MDAMSDTPDTPGDPGTPGTLGTPPVKGRRRLVDPLGRGELLERIERLEAQAAETHQLNLRIAELTDLVAELIVPLAEVEPERAARLLAKYQGELGS